MPSYPSVTPPSKRVSPGRCSPSWGRLLLLLRCLGSAAAPEGGSPRFSVGPTALAPPSSSHRPGQRGGGGEAPPHAVRHRPFKEGDILHINKRGPRERGGSSRSGGRGLGVSGPPNSPSITRPAWVAKRDFGVGGSWGEGGALKQPGSVSQVRAAAGGEARWDPPAQGAGPGRARAAPHPHPAAPAGGKRGIRGGEGTEGTPTAPLPPGERQKLALSPPRPHASPPPPPPGAKGPRGPRPAPRPRSSSEAEPRSQTRVYQPCPRRSQPPVGMGRARGWPRRRRALGMGSGPRR